jgi:hypothetical protein
MGLSQAKVPVIITTAIVCLLVGAAGGVFTMMGVGYVWKKPPPDAAGGPPGSGMPPGGMPFGKMPPGGMPFGKFKEPDPKRMLATLIVKLDQLSLKPLKIDLSKDQQKKVLDQLQGLGEDKELSADEAKKRMASILVILKDHVETLEASGFGPPSQQAPPELTDEATQKHLQSLQKTLSKGKAGD